MPRVPEARAAVLPHHYLLRWSLCLLIGLAAWLAARPAQAESPPLHAVRLHFHRVSHDYTGWGVHVWGTGLQLPHDVSWTRPLEPAGVDAFGIYFDVPVEVSATGFSFILHRGDTKNVPGDQLVELSLHGREVWLLEDTPTVFTAPPPVGSQFQLGVQAEQTAHRTVYLLWGTGALVALGLAVAWGVSQRRLSSTRHQLAGQVALLVEAQQALSTQGERAQRALDDELTGLPTRSGLQQALEQALARCKRHDGRLAVLFVDLDGFKQVNDNAGHDAGDHVLRVLAQRFKTSLRESDVVARVGGDEFVVLVEALHSPFHAAQVGRKLVHAARQAVEGPAGVYQVGASVGVALYPDDGADAAALVKAADTAMYQAKKSGKNACGFHQPGLQQQWAQRLAMEQALGRALECGELALHFLPQIDLADGHVSGLQAELRWPGEADQLPLADLLAGDDDGALADAINGWALLEAGRQALAWKTAGMPPLRVAVPLCGDISRSLARAQEVLRGQRQLAQQLLLQWPAALLDERRVGTEALRALADTGAGLSLAPVGPQDLNLWRLAQLRLSVLKLDAAAFVAEASPAAETMVRSLVALGRTHGFRVVAQGPQGAVQRDWAIRLGCDAAEAPARQAAVPAQAVAALVQRETAEA